MMQLLTTFRCNWNLTPSGNERKKQQPNEQHNALNRNPRASNQSIANNVHATRGPRYCHSHMYSSSKLLRYNRSQIICQFVLQDVHLFTGSIWRMLYYSRKISINPRRYLINVEIITQYLDVFNSRDVVDFCFEANSPYKRQERLCETESTLPADMMQDVISNILGS